VSNVNLREKIWVDSYYKHWIVDDVIAAVVLIYRYLFVVFVDESAECNIFVCVLVVCQLLLRSCAYIYERTNLVFWMTRFRHDVYTKGNSDVISMLAGFRRHLVGKSPTNVFHCGSAEIGLRFLGKLVIIQTFS